jgi:hypothetical protein
MINNVSNYMLMGMMNIIENPHNMWNPCVTQCFDFIIEGIEKVYWVKETLSIARNGDICHKKTQGVSNV